MKREKINYCACERHKYITQQKEEEIKQSCGKPDKYCDCCNCKNKEKINYCRR